MTQPRAAREMIRSYVERVERLNEEIKSLNGDKRDIYAEAKTNGFDVKALKVVVQRRGKDSDELAELESIVATYEAALGTEDATRARASAPAAPEPDKLNTRATAAPRAEPAPAREEIDTSIPDFLDRRSENRSAAS